MTQSRRLPTVVIVGRPNVGKSTLFNCMIGRRRSIVGDESGITRDRIHGRSTYRGRPFELIDTGGILPHDAELIPNAILKQARVALDRAAHIIFLVDGRTELTAADRELAQLLHRLGKPVSLAVNKIDAASRESLVHEFHSLGIADVFPVSAEHRLGLDDLLDHVTATFETAEEEEAKAAPIKVAIIGRPNVGKSTLLNALVGEERAIVSPVAGTTRDAVDETITVGEHSYAFVDTAGIRRKGKTKLMAEKLSVVMARRHIRMANVVVVVLDATEGVVGLDATIAGYAHEEGRGIILCVNKWDAATNKDKKAFTTGIRDAMKYLEYAPVVYLSAKTGAGVRQLLPLICEVYTAASRRVSTGELNRFLEHVPLTTEQRVLYITQPSVRPPTFVLFMDHPGRLHFSTERQLVNRLREQFGYRGTPVVIKIKSKRPR
ncbi:MAG: ribosome biogenesis GTPase Der [Bryobacteraceae bacterium]